MGFLHSRSLLLWLVGAAAAPDALSAQGAILPPPLELRVPKPPTVANADAGGFLTYELHIGSFSQQPMTLKRVEVTTDDAASKLLLALTDSMLLRSISRPGTPLPLADRAKLGGGYRAVVYLWVPVDRAAAPTALRHRVTVELGTGDSARTLVAEGPAVPVVAEGQPIGPPLRGGVWLAGNGPGNESGHRRALIPIGTAAIAQRFAIDYVKVGEDNRTFFGDQLKNESYFAYGSEALAVANGTVVAVKDGIPQNIPGATSRAVPITLETVGGNHVIIDIGGGRYAFYAHLQPGSLRVHLGEGVKRGQVLGLVGNSGNSTEPHLHFHLSDGNSPLGSEGIPYGHDSFELLGRCASFGSGCERSGPVVRHGEIALQNMLVRFR